MSRVNVEIVARTLYVTAVSYCDGVSKSSAESRWGMIRDLDEAKPFYDDARTLITAIGAEP